MNKPPFRDPRNAAARAKSSTNGENSNIDYSKLSTVYELRSVHGVLCDIKAPTLQGGAPMFEQLNQTKAEVYRVDRGTGARTLMQDITPKNPPPIYALEHAARMV